MRVLLSFAFAEMIYKLRLALLSRGLHDKSRISAVSVGIFAVYLP